jgi:NitT/TauT family transport system substrate-binding protein
MRRKFISLPLVCRAIITALLIVSVTSCGGEKRTNGVSDESFDIGMVTFPGYAPLYLAVEKGFFGELDVRLHRIEEIGTLRASVERGALDAYLATLDIALDTDQEPPGVAVWAIDESAGGDGVILTEDIESISDLVGKSIAAEPGLPPYFVLLYLLNQEGLGIQDVDFKDMTTQNAATAFVSGSVDGAGLYEPYLTAAAQQRENSRVVVSSADVPGLIVDLIFADEKVIRERPNDVTTLINGWERALTFIQESPDEANRIMAEAFSLSVDEFVDIASSVRWLSSEENQQLLGRDGQPGLLFEKFKIVLDVLKRNRAAVYDSDARSVLTQQFVR